jgi:hypothetical protein
MSVRKLLSVRGILGVVAVVAGVALVQSPARAQSLTPSANPPSGLAGFNDSYLTGSGFPAGTITGTVAIGASCAAPALATTPIINVTNLGGLRRFEFLIPASLTAGTYQAWVLGTAGTTSFNTLSTPSCSAITVTTSNTTLASCVPTSSLAVVAGSNVTAYVPFGWWGGSTTGIAQVPLEGSASATVFPTPGVVNSCAANSSTSEVVCTENTTNVDLINGTTLTTITSSSNSRASFSGGTCQNCGVGINALNNTAVIAMGLSPSSSNSGVQVLNLSNNTFNTPFPLVHIVSEDISIDPGRNYILSPGEGGIYDLLQIGTNNALAEFGMTIGGTLDSAAEDCTTGIAMSSDEFTDDIFITDLTQAKFTAGSPGTWTAPSQFINLADGGYAAGTSGISSAPGTNHLAVVTGEFGGSAYSALQLPATSGSGTPSLADYAYVSVMPNTPDGRPFSAGFDPHTVTAYTSPNTNKSYAVFADYGNGVTPNFLGVVDLACVLTQPRTAGTHNVIGNASACTRYVAIP